MTSATILMTLLLADQPEVEVQMVIQSEPPSQTVMNLRQPGRRLHVGGAHPTVHRGKELCSLTVMMKIITYPQHPEDVDKTVTLCMLLMCMLLSSRLAVTNHDYD